MGGADANAPQLFVVLYQSCPRRVYIRHVALRFLCALFAVFCVVVAIVASLGAVSTLCRALCIVAAVADALCVGLAILAAVLRIRDEQCRFSDDVSRAGPAGDVQRTLTENKRKRIRYQGMDANTSVSCSPLFALDYDSRSYWCVVPDGGVPSFEACQAARNREVAYNKRDRILGHVFTYMCGFSLVMHFISAVFTLLSPADSANPVINVNMRSVVGPLLFGGAAALIVVVLLAPFHGGAGMLWFLSNPSLPTGVLEMEYPVDPPVRVRPAVYAEALPGPPLEELTGQAHLIAAVSPRGYSPHEDILTTHNVQNTESITGEERPKPKEKEKTATEGIWVLGGFLGSNTDAAVTRSEGDHVNSDAQPAKRRAASIREATAPLHADSESGSDDGSSTGGSHSPYFLGHL